MNQAIKLLVCQIPMDFEANPAMLTQAQRHRAKTMSAKRLREFSASRTLLNTLLEDNWEFNESDRKNLRVSNSSSFRAANLSHSNDYIAIALGPLDVEIKLGVDIEKIRSNWSTEKVGFFCNATQCEKGKALDQQQRSDFYSQLWTQKEAYFKATQLAFVQKDFEHCRNIYSHKLNSEYYVSVYADPTMGIELQQLNLNSA